MKKPYSKRGDELKNNDSEMYGQDSKEIGKVLSKQNSDELSLGPFDHIVDNEKVGEGEIEVPLYNIRDVEYLGFVFVGSPVAQKAKVVLDSGSNWLTVKACISEKSCHKGPKKVRNPKTGKPLRNSETGEQIKVMKTDVAYWWN